MAIVTVTISNACALGKCLLSVLLLSVLAGCAARNITLSSDYPTPLVNKTPVTVGVYYPDELRDFIYREINDFNGKDEYVINTGEAQIKLFDTILPVMFDDVVILNQATTDDPSVDAVFVPQLMEFQLGLPQKTKLSVYEIWMKYNMRVTQPNGDYIADWNMTAYGKSPTESFQSAEAGIQNAAEVAMRDLAASFSLGFSEITDVKEWLQKIDHQP